MKIVDMFENITNTETDHGCQDLPTQGGPDSGRQSDSGGLTLNLKGIFCYHRVYNISQKIEKRKRMLLLNIRVQKL